MKRVVKELIREFALFLLLAILAFLLGFKIGSSREKKVYVKVPEIIKEVQPQIVKEVKTIKVKDCIRRWKEFSFSDEFINIRYFAYDSSSGLRYEINGDRFMFPVEIEKEVIKEMEKRQKKRDLGFNIGLMYNTDLKLRNAIYPVFGLRYKFISLSTTITLKRPCLLLTFTF